MSQIHIARDLKLVPIETLKAYERNARTHSEEQIKQIAASITEHGFLNPILIDGDKGIIAGHGRLAAAKRLKLEKVPVIELTHLTPAQKRAYIIADNKIALNAGWDMELLASEVAALGGEVEDWDSIGFSEDEISDLLAGIGDLPDDEPEQSQPVRDEPEEHGDPEETDDDDSEDSVDEHWQGMPEFHQEDKTPHRTLYVHFKNDKDVERFAMLVKQTITDKTKFLWFPFIEIETIADKEYSGGAQ